ncbi:type VI secretion system baseplate subunit TssE [Fluviispira vulneris]|uniref:type VI secretion system baseplate subunit TssE n=1 Tax=Fluviispira vulneris TaxID=2763012 RepID=UPI0016479ECB|nr:type VI secretion system baseplate subunit TssE [Fluviispira vulneris]
MIRLLEDKYLQDDIHFSVKSNFDYILNTRNTLTVNEFLSLQASQLNSSNFGLPNVNKLSLANEEDKESLCSCIKLALNSFEPRFKNINVSFQNYDKNKRVAKICVSGFIDVNNATINLFLHVSVWKFNCE